MLVEHNGFWGDVVLSDIYAKQRGVILKRRNSVEEEGSDGGSRQHNPAPTEVAGKETSEGGLLKCYSSVLSKQECLIKLRAVFLLTPSFITHGGKKGSSHFDETLSF